MHIVSWLLWLILAISVITIGAGNVFTAVAITALMKALVDMDPIRKLWFSPLPDT